MPRVYAVGGWTDAYKNAIPRLLELPGYDAASWWMLVAPGKTPRPIVDKLHTDLRIALREPDVRERVYPAPGLDSGRLARPE